MYMNTVERTALTASPLGFLNCLSLLLRELCSRILSGLKNKTGVLPMEEKLFLFFLKSFRREALLGRARAKNVGMFCV